MDSGQVCQKTILPDVLSNFRFGSKAAIPTRTTNGEPPMKTALISDTHNLVRPEALAALHKKGD